MDVLDDKLKYYKAQRESFVKVIKKYTVGEHLELRTEVDSLLIAYDQMVANEEEVVNRLRDYIAYKNNRDALEKAYKETGDPFVGKKKAVITVF